MSAGLDYHTFKHNLFIQDQLSSLLLPKIQNYHHASYQVQGRCRMSAPVRTLWDNIEVNLIEL